MVEFEVVYAYGAHRENLLISKVYAVNEHDFLLVDGDGKFKWVPMRFCVLLSRWKGEYPDNTDNTDNADTEPTLDSYDRIVAAGL